MADLIELDDFFHSQKRAEASTAKAGAGTAKQLQAESAPIMDERSGSEGKTATHAYTLRMSPTLWQNLNAWSSITGLTKSQILRLALAGYLITEVKKKLDEERD